jgi:23S rRNA pseudouridine2605 synthase
MKTNRRPRRESKGESPRSGGTGKRSFTPRGRGDDRSGPPKREGRGGGRAFGKPPRRDDAGGDSAPRREGFARGAAKSYGTRSFDGPRGGKSSFRKGPGGFQKRDDGFKKREGGFEKREGGYGKREGGFGKREGGYAKREGGYGKREGGFGNRTGGFRKSEGGPGKRAGAFGKREGGSANREGGFKKREGGFARKDGGFSKREGGFGKRDGDFQKRDDNFGTKVNFEKGEAPFEKKGGLRKSGGSFAKRGAGFKKKEGGFGKKVDDSKSFVESRIEKQREATPKHTRHEVKAEAAPEDELIRLNRFIANAGVCSRREADELIRNGLVIVNGNVVTEMGHKVKRTDNVQYDGKKLSAEKPVYILMNKPKGFITTTDDPQERNTVMHIIAGACKERVYPVGRLDRNTTGLLLITNDGDVADKLTHPSYNAKKIYKVELDRPISKNDLQAIADGVQLEEGRAVVDDLAVVSDDKKTIGLEIHIGWNHVVRRIFESLNYQVMKLDRVVYAGLDKKDLKRGQWRFLTKEEIVRIKHFK